MPIVRAPHSAAPRASAHPHIHRPQVAVHVRPITEAIDPRARVVRLTHTRLLRAGEDRIAVVVAPVPDVMPAPISAAVDTVAIVVGVAFPVDSTAIPAAHAAAHHHGDGEAAAAAAVHPDVIVPHAPRAVHSAEGPAALFDEAHLASRGN